MPALLALQPKRLPLLMARCGALVLLAFTSAPVDARSILFVGNSFTFGSNSPVMTYGARTVADLNRDGVGGVPALFQSFSDQLGLGWRVSLETSAGKTLEWHWNNKRQLLDRKWDAVVLQDYSTLDPDRPGDPSKTVTYSGLLADMFRRRSSRVDLSMTATWSRPNLTYPRGEKWSGQPIQRMARDVHEGYNLARAAHPSVSRINPVGEAFNCAIARGIADPNPYDGIAPGKIDLWADDHYHASTAGYYLEALVIFAGVTGTDPGWLGRREGAARDLGIDEKLAVRLQKIAQDMTHRGGCKGKAGR
jgi:hypothetical protein